jgi:DNA repair exonuclease SbcCD nuclease subunit
MKFAHLADIHLGAWRDVRLSSLSSAAFIQAIDRCIAEPVDFIVISGDLFHTSIPSIDHLKLAVKKFRQAKNAGIPIYIIAGSHDFSPSGKTMIDVLEEAGLVTNILSGRVNERGELILSFITDQKTKAKLCGIIGLRGMLDKRLYHKLASDNLAKEPGYKIFLFHTAITELLPKDLSIIESSSVSLLPKGFDYYAGGHIHIVKDLTLPTHAHVTYPGPLFPVNFLELERLHHGGFFLVENNIPSYISLPQKAVSTFHVIGTSPENITQQVKNIAEQQLFTEHIVLLRIEGNLTTGKAEDVNTMNLAHLFSIRGASLVLINKTKLQSQTFTETPLEEHSADDIETLLVREMTKEHPEPNSETVQQLIKVLSLEKLEGEKTADYQAKIKRNANDTLLL